jgi:hypothetical protein
VLHPVTFSGARPLTANELIKAAGGTAKTDFQPRTNANLRKQVRRGDLSDQA